MKEFINSGMIHFNLFSSVSVAVAAGVAGHQLLCLLCAPSIGGDLHLVDRPEQYVAAMMGIPLMKQRLDAHLFALNFAENYKDAYNPVDAISEACDSLKGCKNLKSILFAILELGNMLNGGDPQRGNADGFKPTTLAKLTEVRSTTKPIRTLLQYLCDVRILVFNVFSIYPCCSLF